MLTDAQIAVLCDIGQSVAFSDDKHQELMRLIADGYVEKDGDTFRLTAKGETAVVDRGAGLNEA
jgi:coproporphyrinogen III oxidase-like Fe-S oxidoreductase